MKKKRITNIVFILLGITLLLLLIPFHFVNANSPPPYKKIWLIFDLDQKTWQDIKGIQIIGCTTEKCDEPILLQQFGVCDSEKCLKEKGIFDQEGDKLICVDFRCLSEVYSDSSALNFRVLVQLPGKSYISNIGKSFDSSNWKITLQADSLQIKADTSENIGLNNPLFISFPIFFLSIFFELVTAYLYLNKLFNANSTKIVENITIVLLVNLITLPVVWYFFPALGYFHTIQRLNHGIFVVCISFVFTLLLIKIYGAPPERRERLTVLGFIFAAVSFCLLLGSFVLSLYGAQNVIANGLPAYVIIIMDEIFAIVVEALLIIKFSNQEIPKKHAWILALGMNAVSFFLGYVIQMISK